MVNRMAGSLRGVASLNVEKVGEWTVKMVETFETEMTLSESINF